MDGLTGVPEQLAGTSTNGKAEPTLAVQIDPATTTTLSNWLNHLEKQRDERPKPKGKIHRVPDLLKANSKSSSDYQPKMVSLGPFHFGEFELTISKELKRSIAERLMPDEKLKGSLRSEIKKNIDNLKDAYSLEIIETAAPSEADWEEMFFLDGCFVLHFLFCIMYDRVEDLKMKKYEIELVHHDLFLLENQLPYELLKILSGNDPKLLHTICEYICMHKVSNDNDKALQLDEPVHLLDCLRTIIIGRRREPQKKPQEIQPRRQWPARPPAPAAGTKCTVLRSAKELTAKRIRLKPNKSGFSKDVQFKSRFVYGSLKLPRIIVDDTTRPLFLNLAAYETCAGIDSVITSYICFLDSLVNRAEDIKVLQSAGILVNHLPTVEDAANLFNEMPEGLHPDMDAFMDVKRKIQKFLDDKTKASTASWRADMDGLTDMPEQLAGTSPTGKAEPTHTLQIDPDQKLGQPKITTTRSNWLNHSEKQRKERSKLIPGKIHMVPEMLRANSKSSHNYYQPKVVSLGPYHFGEDRFRKFQKLKPLMAKRLVPDKELEDSMRSELRKSIGNLMDAYSSDKMKTATLSEWEEMFFLDGCFVLHFIFCILYNRVEDLEIKKYEINLVHNDLFLVENQLPFQLLQILSVNDSELLKLVDDYIYTYKISNDVRWGWWQDKPVHLLDRLRTIVIGPRSDTSKWQHAIRAPWQWPSTPPTETKKTVLRPAKELTVGGIHLKPNRTGFLKYISFRSHFIYGTLRLPKIIVDNSTRLLFLNLAAFEMCADIGSTITSYICFLDSLVNRADDIKELQSAGVLVNHLATEELAANLFNEMSQGLHLHPNEDTYMDVKEKIHKFFQHKTKASIALWAAECYHNHFKSPLTIMAVLAAFLALGLGATQTYFTIYPSGNK